MILRLSKNNDYKDVIKSYPSGVIDAIHTIKYYVVGNENKAITASFEKENDVLVAILPSSSLKTMPSGILYRKAFYKVEDSDYPDGYYDLEIVDNMNVWLGDEFTSPSAIYVKPEDLKTINGESIVGSGDIEIEGGGVTMDEVDDEIDEKLEGYATQEWVEETAEVPASNVTCDISSDMFDFSDVDTGLNRIVDEVEDLSTGKEDKKKVYTIHYAQGRTDISYEQFLAIATYVKSNGQDNVRIYLIDDMTGYRMLVTEMHVTDSDFRLFATDGSVRIEIYDDGTDAAMEEEDIVGTGDLSSYATKAWVNEQLGDIDTTITRILS